MEIAHVPEEVVADNWIAVFCRKCNEAIGFVTSEGHREWICPECTRDGKWEAVDVVADDAARSAD